MIKALLPEEFDPEERAYPFPDGEIAPGVVVSAEGVKFFGQRGPVQETGVNGCQIDDLIRFCRETVAGFNAKFPCRENSLCVTKLDEALLCLCQRQHSREERGVEGTNQA